ncbi:MAG TPA: DMT family transporter [Nitrolancea sp.]|nr:DMT family transporter [Nitrolancea sp.]
MKPIHLIQLLVLGVLWGSSYLFIKVAVDGVDPATLVAGRLAIGSLFLVTMMRARGLTLNFDRIAWFHIVTMAVIGVVMPQVLIAWSEQHVSSSVASILNATTPFFTFLFAAGVFQTESFSREKIAGLVVGFAGVGALTGRDILDLASNSAQGQIALLLSSVGYGVAFAYARRYMKGEPLSLASGQMLVSTALMIPGMLLFGDVGSTQLTLTRVAAWLALGAFSSGVAYVLYYQLIAAVGATTAAFGTYLIPVVGVFWGWLLLDEAVSPRTFVGVALILAGLAIATRMRRRVPLTQATPS